MGVTIRVRMKTVAQRQWDIRARTAAPHQKGLRRRRHRIPMTPISGEGSPTGLTPVGTAGRAATRNA
jgi:hypothetical protein